MRQNHLKLRQAAREYGVPKSTLFDQLTQRKKGTDGQRKGYSHVLAVEEEQALVSYVEYMASQGFPFTRAILRCYIREIVRRSGNLIFPIFH
ncbi:MAG: helix-turn-helix domain-containing protein [Sedimenticola sp.]